VPVNKNIKLVSQFNNLGIKLNFSPYAEMIKNKAMRNLGFIKLIYECYSLENFTYTPPLFVFI